MKNAFLFVLAALTFNLAQDASAMTLPLNNLSLQDNPRVLYNIPPQLFKQIIDQVVTTFSPVVRMHGGELKANYLWDDPTVNAMATREGNVWALYMYGGLARRKEITPDGFTIVVCHELGHHLGGYPFKGPVGAYPNAWAASEGQADYFATQTCARAVWWHDAQQNAWHRYTVDPLAKSYCDRALPTQMERDLCYRTSDAGQSLANLLNVLGDATHPVRYQNARSNLLVSQTYTEHPDAQCRLETYLNGAICRRQFDTRIIPGLDIQLTGGSEIDEEKEAAKFSCGERGAAYDGSRPRCWFQPLIPNWF